LADPPAECPFMVVVMVVYFVPLAETGDCAEDEEEVGGETVALAEGDECESEAVAEAVVREGAAEEVEA